jgi:hypothetical protein
MAWPEGGVTLTVKHMEDSSRPLGNAILSDKEEQLVTFRTLNELKMAIKLQNQQKIRIVDELTEEIIQLLAATGSIIVKPTIPSDALSRQKLANLLDVDVTNKNDGDILYWNEAMKKFMAKAFVPDENSNPLPNPNSSLWIDVTESPYNAKGDGVTDKTPISGKSLMREAS